MRFRQFFSPTSKTLYDVCLNQAPFYRNEPIDETRPDHSYARPWVDDPTLATALPRVELFSCIYSSFRDDSNLDIDNSPSATEANTAKINWAPTVNTIIPDLFECPANPDNTPALTPEQETLVRDVREFIDETRIAALCCELNACDVVYWRLSIHRIVAKLASILGRQPSNGHLLIWLHEHICKTFDRYSIGLYTDLFQVLYHEYAFIRSWFVYNEKLWPSASLCTFVFNKILQKPHDLTEEVIYSLALSPLPVPVVCLLIPGVAYAGHMKRMHFWQKNLSQVTTVMLSVLVPRDDKSDENKIQLAYDDILKKFTEIQQLYPSHNIVFLGWNVGCILALKAALVCPVSSVICMSLPFLAMSEETKTELTRSHVPMLFVTGQNQCTNLIDQYRERLQARNGLVELGECDDKLLMSEYGKYRFRLTQQMIDKLIMEEILDFLTIISSKFTHNDRKQQDLFDHYRDISEEHDGDGMIKNSERVNSASSSIMEDTDDLFLYTGETPSHSIGTTLTIAPEQDPQSVFLNSFLSPLSVGNESTARKRKGPNLFSLLENDRRMHTNSDFDVMELSDPLLPVAKRPRNRPMPTGKKGAPTTTTTTGIHSNLFDDIEWAPDSEKRPIKSTSKKKPTMAPTATTSILNTLLQLPSHQPRKPPQQQQQRPNEIDVSTGAISNIIKSIHQPPLSIQNVLSSAGLPHPFLP